LKSLWLKKFCEIERNQIRDHLNISTASAYPTTTDCLIEKRRVLKEGKDLENRRRRLNCWFGERVLLSEIGLRKGSI